MALSGSPLEIILGIVAFWLMLALLGLVLQGRPRLTTALVYPASALGSMAMLAAGLSALPDNAATLVLPLGLPGLPFHLRLDALSSIFLVLLGGAGAGVSLYSAGYFRGLTRQTLALVTLQYHIFMAAMAMVILADDAYLFMVAWETMALASYFLVVTNHRLDEVRAAGFIYLLVAHVGAIAILLAFGILQAGDGDYTFASMRAGVPTPFWGSCAFLLALFGFGAKAGLLPVHVWLPEAHPAAPSPVSALMSGVMLKTAVYGLIRVSFDLIEGHLWWWGVVALAVGLVTAFYGVMFAAVQADMKRLLAYSSIENVGLITVGLGLALLFHGFGQTTLAALALAAAVLHCVNHSLFKTLLFLGTGSVLHATGERNLGRLGGLIRTMPFVAAVCLVGALAIAGLPPLNGFASEWLLLQAFLLSPGLPHSYLNMLIPVAAGAVALSAALSGYVMVKFYGIIFLGRPREARLAQAHDAGPWEKAGFAWLVAGCVLLGLFPVQMVQLMDPLLLQMTGSGLGETMRHSGILYLAPLAPERASYGPIAFLLVIVAVVGTTILTVGLLYHKRTRRAPAWDCGFPAQTPRMQDTADGFGQPIRRIFQPFFLYERETPTPFDEHPRFTVKAQDRIWFGAYLPIGRAVNRFSQWLARVQQGRVQAYLIYSFVTLLVLLLVVR